MPHSGPKQLYINICIHIKLCVGVYLFFISFPKRARKNAISVDTTFVQRFFSFTISQKQNICLRLRCTQTFFSFVIVVTILTKQRQRTRDLHQVKNIKYFANI